MRVFRVFSGWMEDLDSRWVHLNFVFEKLALGQVFSPRTLALPYQCHSTSLHTHVHLRAYKDEEKSIPVTGPVVAQRVGRDIALLFHDHRTRRGWVVSSTPRPYFISGKDPVPIVQEAGCAPGPVWTGGKSRPSPGFDPRTVQPVVRRYTDWATRATRLSSTPIRRTSGQRFGRFELSKVFRISGNVGQKSNFTLLVLFCDEFIQNIFDANSSGNWIYCRNSRPSTEFYVMLTLHPCIISSLYNLIPV